MRYLVVVEKGPTSFGAYVPDLPGCIAVGETREEVLQSIHEAIEFHLEGLTARWRTHSSGDLVERNRRSRCLGWEIRRQPGRIARRPPLDVLIVSDLRALTL